MASIKIGDLVCVDEQHGDFIGLCVGITKNKKIWQRRANILWIGTSRISSISIQRLKVAYKGFNSE